MLDLRQNAFYNHFSPKRQEDIHEDFIPCVFLLRPLYDQWRIEALP